MSSFLGCVRPADSINVAFCSAFSSEAKFSFVRTDDRPYVSLKRCLFPSLVKPTLISLFSVLRVSDYFNSGSISCR